MTCTNCQKRITKALQQAHGIIKADVSYKESYAEIIFDNKKISYEQINEIINSLGYEISDNKTKIIRNISVLLTIIAIYNILSSSGILNFLVPGQLADSKMSYGMLFIIGLITSVHCVAMCGGINLSQSLSNIKSFYPSIIYNAGRVLSYTIIGGILGSAGFFANGTGKFEISIFLQSALKITAGIFMTIMGAKMLNLFHFLRKFSIRLPKFLSDKIFLTRMNKKSPLFIGLLNGLMPCGPLQAMWLIAFTSCNPLTGALSMLMFALGTLPLMLGLSSIISALGKKFSNFIMTSGAVLVTVMGLLMISQGINLSGIFQEKASNSQEVKINAGLQKVNSTLSSGRYPDIEVKAGTPVEWTINAPKGSINGCNYKFMIPEYGIEHTFKTGENIIEFTPTRSGTFYYHCWMGMIRGKILVSN